MVVSSSVDVVDGCMVVAASIVVRCSCICSSAAEMYYSTDDLIVGCCFVDHPVYLIMLVAALQYFP